MTALVVVGQAIVVLIIAAIAAIGVLMVLATANVPSPTAEDQRTASRGRLLVIVAIAACVLFFAY